MRAPLAEEAGIAVRGFDPAEDDIAFRAALGTWPTGVSIVTCSDDDGKPVGMTVNSFASVSLNPPLILWSVDRSSGCYQAFAAASHFAVNFLDEDERSLALRFAEDGDRFGSVEWEAGRGGAPLLEGASLQLECRTEHHYDGGDHAILVGRVLQVRQSDTAGHPLVFHQGAFKGLTR